MISSAGLQATDLQLGAGSTPAGRRSYTAPARPARRLRGRAINVRAAESPLDGSRALRRPFSRKNVSSQPCARLQNLSQAQYTPPPQGRFALVFRAARNAPCPDRGSCDDARLGAGFDSAKPARYALACRPVGERHSPASRGSAVGTAAPGPALAFDVGGRIDSAALPSYRRPGLRSLPAVVSRKRGA
jgi:hypothetical protein